MIELPDFVPLVAGAWVEPAASSQAGLASLSGLAARQLRIDSELADSQGPV